MPTVVQKWGNSHGIRFTKKMLDDARIRPGESVSIRVVRGTITIKKQLPSPKKISLEDLLARIPKHMLQNGRVKKTIREEFSGTGDFGRPVGKEAW